MNETDIRTRLRDAMGEADYPPALTNRVAARLSQPASPAHPRVVGVVAAVLALLIVASLAYIRVQSARAPQPVLNPSPAQTGRHTPAKIALLQIPQSDVAAAELMPAITLVSDPDLSSTSSGRTVRLIGAYADTARIVLILRSLPEGIAGALDISDDRGRINAGGGGGSASLGDGIYIVRAGPHAGPDGVAHLKVSIASFEGIPPSQRSTTTGQWSFSFPVKVQPAIPLPLQPSLKSVGTWKVTVEAFELTPSVIHFKGVIDGASADTAGLAVSLLDDAGKPIGEPGSAMPIGGSHTVWRVDATWPRPNAAATYRLRIAGGRGEYQTKIAIPAPPSLDSITGLAVNPMSPYDFASATQTLTLQGVINDEVYVAHPQLCRVVNDGSGSSAPVFQYMSYFLSNGVWYYVAFMSDPADQPYHGPATYLARAFIGGVTAVGPTDRMFTGSVHLTVTSDQGLHTGSVNGSLSWTDDPKQKVNLTGTWTCKPSS